MDVVGLIVQLIAGAVGGNVAGKASSKFDMGGAGNSIVGAIGGVVLGQIIERVTGGAIPADAAAAATQGLDLADEHVLKGVNGLAGLLDLGADGVGNELADEVLEVDSRRFLGHDVRHALADRLDLRCLGIGCLLKLVLPLLGEGKAEHSKLVSVRRRHVHLALDSRLQKQSMAVSNAVGRAEKN